MKHLNKLNLIKLYRVFIMFFLPLCFLVGQVFPQQTSDQRAKRQEEIRRQIENSRKEQREKENREINLRNLSSELSKKTVISKRLSAKDKKYLTPDKEFKQKYKNLLNLKDTRILKILNFGNCFSDQQFIPSEDCRTTMPGFGANYSFRDKEYVNSNQSDINLYQRTLSSQGFQVQGIFVELGEMDFKQISTNSKGLKFLTDFVPAKTLTEAKQQSVKFQNGFNNDDFKYWQQIRLKENKLYALRTIAYKSDVKMYYADKRNDLIVVFKVIKIEDNGNTTIIWRKLKQQKAPKLEGN